jgi:tetratricopeptide (TPR) repeat protein
LLNVGKPDEAKEHLAEAVRLDRTDAVASSNLAGVLLTEGKHRQAAELYSRSLEQEPNQRRTLLGLATIRATSSDPTLRDGDRAIELATRACELTRFLDPAALDVQGMAFAEAGRFRDAVSTAQRAVRRAQASGNAGLADAIEQRIKLYRQQIAFRRQHSP